jgi:cation/acetate symporter
MTYIMGQMRGVGVVFSQLFGIGIPAGVMIGAGIVFVYAGLGGMKGITYTQVAQYCVMAFAYTIPAFYIAIALTGNLVPQLGFIGNYIQGDEPIAFLEKLNRINQELGFSRYTDGSMSTTDMFCITAALMCGTAGLPHVIVRFFTVKNVQAVRKSACWTLGFIAVIYLTAPTIGAFSRVNLINNLNGVKHSEAPEWFAQFEKTGQMKFKDKNKDGIIQYVGPLAYRTADGTLAVAESQDAKTAMQLSEHDADPNELIFGADIMVMANPYMADVPPWAIALLMAGCIAAALSTAAGLLLVLSTSISHDLMKKIVKPELTDREEVNYARLAAFVSLAVATYFGINPPSAFIAKTVAFAFGLAASSFFPTLLLGIFWKKMSREGAIAGMICGIGFTLAYILYFQFLGGTKEQHLLGISPEGIGTIGMLINFAVAFIVNLFSPPPPQEVQEMVENIHIPSGATEATTH